MYKKYVLIVFSLIVFLIIWHSPQFLSKNSLVYSQKQQNSNSLTLPSEQKTIVWKNYSNSKFGFSIEYPSNWIIKEKTNRFEKGVDLTIQSDNIISSTDGEFTFTSVKSEPIDDISFITDFGKKQLVDNYFSLDFEHQIVEDVNTSKYIIDGEKAGSFTYSSIDKNTNEALSGAEVINTLHNGNLYIFQYIANANHFDDPQNAAIREHMFNSIKWLS